MKYSKAQSSTFGLQKLPNRHLKALWFIALLVIGLPLLAFAASLTTNLTPKAFLPTGQTICKQALTNYNFSKPCTLTNSSASQGYFSFTFTCADGYTRTNPSTTICRPQSEYLSEAYIICTEHSYAKSIEYVTTCRPTGVTPSATNNNTRPTFAKTTNYTCFDGTAGVYSAGCQSSAQISAAVRQLCLKHGLCSSTSPSTSITPTRTITPIPPVTITDSPTRNVAPQITTTSLPAGNINSTYEGYVDATDANKTDELTMTMSGLPFGLSQGPCASLATGGRITCYITGTPANTGIYSVKINVKDNRGGSTDKSLTLSVYEGRPSPTPLYTPIIPPPIQ